MVAETVLLQAGMKMLAYCGALRVLMAVKE